MMELLYRYGGLWIDSQCCVVDDRINDILEKEELRQEILNNNKSLDIMNKYKTITTISNMEYETLDKVAEYFEVDYDCIKILIQRNKEELREG